MIEIFLRFAATVVVGTAGGSLLLAALMLLAH